VSRGTTEDIAPGYEAIDSWPIEGILDGLLAHQEEAVAAVRAALPQLLRAAAAAEPRLREGGRLVYVGAGTSGRLGVQDGVELTPTYSWPRERVVYVLAGGDAALTRSIEGAEDDGDAARLRLREAGLTAKDIVIAVAASGSTPFALAAVDEAQAVGALAIGIACNPGAPLLARSTCPILLATGPEAVSGSTRLKAGTAQKAALNLLSTTLMIRLGRVFQGLMVDLQATNEKLKRRSERILARLTGCSADEARATLFAAEGALKVAIVMRLAGVARDEAMRRLAAADGILRRALDR
jgi:N-acetylmuramic acid 6-phosphate etherase